MSNYEFHNGLRNPGLYSLISHKSVKSGLIDPLKSDSKILVRGAL